MLGVVAGFRVGRWLCGAAVGFRVWVAEIGFTWLVVVR